MRALAAMLAVAFGITLSACSVEERAQARLFADAKVAVRESLRDPGSADVTNMTVSTTDSGVVCGTVTARNGFGGMTGPLSFYVKNGRAYVQPVRDIGVFMGGWAPLCSTNASAMQTREKEKDDVVTANLMREVDELIDTHVKAPVSGAMRACLLGKIRELKWEAKYPVMDGPRGIIFMDTVVLRNCRREIPKP